MSTPWTETGDEARIEIAFDGVDVEKRDAREMASFQQALKAPAEEREIHGLGSSFLVRPASSLDPLRAVLIGVGAFVGYLGVKLVDLVAGILGSPVSASTSAVVFLVLLLSPALAVSLYPLYFRWRAGQFMSRASRALTTDRFILTLGRSGLSVMGRACTERTFDLGAIDGFEGGRRIAVRMRDGTRQELPCALPIAADHPALAARLDELLVTARASAGGYRGAPVRVALEQESAELDAEAGDAEGARKKQRRK